MFNIIWIGFLIFALVKVKSLILMILTSIVFASFIGTSANSLKSRIGVSRGVSVAFMYIITVAIFSIVFYFFIPVLLEELVNIAPFVSQFFPGTSSIGGVDISSLDSAGTIANELSSNSAVDQIADNLVSVLNNVSSGFLATLSTFFGGIANVVLVAVISFYLSMSRNGIENFLRIVTPIQNEEYVIGLWARAQKKIALWITGQVVLGLIVGVLTFIGLKILNVEYAFLLAVVAGLFELIPFGIFLAAIPAVTLSFASGGVSLALMVIALYIIIQQLEGYVIAPLVVQKATGISPLVVILSVLVGINLAGFWGLILAIPVAVTILEYVRDVEMKKLKEIESLKLQKNV
ncbi:MAG: AI-2E family transporter [Candidatus Paceibacterota bacterium]